MNKFSFIVRMLAVFGLLLGASTALAATNDSVNYWTFDEGAGRSVNDLIGGQNGVLTGSSTGFGWAGGKVGTALGMDGSAGESVVLPNGMLKGTQGTLALWFKMNSLSERNILFSAKSTSDNNIYMALSVDRDGRPQMQFRDSSSGNDRKAQGTKLLNANEWYDLVITASGQTYHLYINGEEVTVAGENWGRWFSDMTNQTLSYRMGSLDAIPMSGVLNGYLDDVRIYNRVLSFDEVSALYAEGNAAVPTIPLEVRPMLSFSAGDARVPFGGSVLLEWSSKNVTQCTASGSWSGPVSLSGSQVFTKLGSDATYTMACTGKAGNVAASVIVGVDEKGALTGTTSSALPKGTLTVTEVTSTPNGNMNAAAANTSSAMKERSRHDEIQGLIDQILVLIGELQKQLAQLKAAAH